MLGVVLGALAIAAANGANDTMKGVASLLASGAAGYRRALAWAALTTFAGALAAAFLGSRLGAAFSGAGLVPASVAMTPAFLAAVALGAAVTVGIAARAGLPVSTTHAILGALVGAGLVASAGHLNLALLSQRFLAPLVLSPIAAFALVAAVTPLLVRLRQALAVEPTSCVCVSSPVALVVAGNGVLAQRTMPMVHACDRRYSGTVAGVDAQQVISGAHFASAGIQSFARGLNDTPKIAALAGGLSLAGVTLAPPVACLAVALAMLSGGWLGARRVGETMSERIATLNEGQALTANGITSALVLAASAFALPVSMTHVAVGAIAGSGWTCGGVRWGTLRSIALSWVGTLPLAAVLAALSYLAIGRIVS